MDLTPRQKAKSLIAYGLADDMDDAYAQLVDMGEIDEDDIESWPTPGRGFS